MDEPTAAILGALIGAGSGLSIALLTGWRQSRLEYQNWLRARKDEERKWTQVREDEERKWLQVREDEERKWLQVREDEERKEIRLAIVELTKNLAIGLQAMEWLTWKAQETPDSLTEEDILIFDKEMKAQLPEIVSSHVLVAALSKSKYDRLTPLVNEVYKLDVQVAQASLLWKKSPQESIQPLADLHTSCLKFHRKLEQEVTGIISFSSESLTIAP